MQVSEYRTILVINNRVVYAASHHVERRNWHCVMHRLTITVSAEITSLAERLRIHQPVVFFANVWVRTEKNTPVVRNQTIHMRNPIVSYDFSAKCYKFPSYLRRAAIVEALGKVSSYRSNLANWETGKQRSRQNAGSNRHCRRWDTCIRPCTVPVCLSVPRCIGQR